MTRDSRRTWMVVGVLILLASLVPFSQPVRHTVAWRVPSGYENYMDRALTAGAAAFAMSREEYRRSTRPQISRDRHQICVTLATHRSDSGGSHTSCYDNQTGALIFERTTSGSFGAEGLWDRYGGWVW